MKINSGFIASVVLLSASTFPQFAVADQTVKCESEHYKYTTCSIPDYGYVRLDRKTSKAACIQGRTWDYDRRHIWVDDGCAGVFVVETRHHTDDHDDHKGEAAVAAVAGLAILAAAAAVSDKDNDDDYDDRYSSDTYHHGGHSSYVPGWMRGSFKGYNSSAHKYVYLDISSDGRVRADVAGLNVQGYVNDEKLYMGDLVFDIERAGSGFNTIERGNHRNSVHYIRD